ncbi:MAG TPA: AAA family ATPase, partial [Microbacteriaceae bacterium]|nr:AAA family ATPase [Microbacteriaceae bacterium]
MIEEVRIRNLGVISEAVLPLGPGFTAVTGETGAGKTMVVTALGLVLGERADAGAVRSGADQAEIDASVRVIDRPEIERIVDEIGGRIEDRELLLSRTVSAEGRSRASVGGRSAPVGVLDELSTHLVAVHGQSEQIRLRSAAAQRDALDRFAGEPLIAVRAKYRDSYLRARELQHTLDALAANREALERESELLRAQIGEIEAVNPVPGEDAELAVRIERLANTEALRLAAGTAHDAISSESIDGVDVLALLETARRSLERSNDPELEPLATELADIGVAAREIAGSLARFVANLEEAGPGEIDALNERRAALTALVRKYAGPEGGLESVLEFAEAAGRRLLEIDTSDAGVARLREELVTERARVLMLAHELSAARQAAA